jgi:hypothetical protein
MEGGCRRVARVASLIGICTALALGAAACGAESSSDSQASAVRTDSPLATFAPLLEVAQDEPWRPMSARWFIERSSFWFAEDEGCPDRKIAVGHALAAEWNPTIDWIFPKGLGGWSWPAYYRNPYDKNCETDFDKRFDANQLTRPHDPGVRAEGIKPGEGFYLDLVDDYRTGPAFNDGREIEQPVYAERTDEGDSGVRLTYWTLYGMRGQPGRRDAREGDWRRVDVLLQDHGDGNYEALSVQVPKEIDMEWDGVRRVRGTHPVVRVARGTHEAEALTGDAVCQTCIPWKTWRVVKDARKELWYGFGGAWGDAGATDATTGPLGPHLYFPSAAATEPAQT